MERERERERDARQTPILGELDRGYQRHDAVVGKRYSTD
jgi:hypothetical protein